MRPNKVKYLKYTVFAILALVLTVCGNVKNMKVEAAVLGYISEVKQQGIDKTSITVQWTPADNATSYQVYYQLQKENGKGEVLFNTVSQTNCTITGLLPGQKYNVKIVPKNETETGILNSKSIQTVTLFDKVQGLKQEMWYAYSKELKISWQGIDTAEGYETVLYDDKNKKVSQKTVKGGTSNTFGNMKEKVYTVKARAFMMYEGKKYYTSWASVKCIKQANVKSIKIKDNKLNIKWDKVAGATGYNIYVSRTDMKKDFKKVGTVKKNSTSFTAKSFKGKKFNSSKLYYVYVETICNTKNSKNTSGAVYIWDNKTGEQDYFGDK